MLFCVISLGGLVSCGEWLNLQPEDGVIRQEFWQTKEEAESALMGCYAQLMSDDMMTDYFIWGEMRADLVTPTSRANADLLAIRNGEITAENRYCSFASFYRAINQCNTVIELAPTVKDRDRSFDDKMLKQYQAEATCIRSLCYFYLLRTFRDVPYVTDASIYDDQTFSVEKNTQDEILSFLVRDLLAVQADLPFSYESVAATKGRFTGWSLKALLADIYLWQENYQACADLCTQIIESGQFSLIPVRRTSSQVLNLQGDMVDVWTPNQSDMNSLFDQVYVQGNSSESILELQFSGDKGNPFVGLFKPVSGTLTTNADGISMIFPSSELDNGWRDVRYEFSIKQNSIWKWIGLDENNYRADDASFSNWIFYRLPDIMLMKADALTQLAKAADNDSTMLADAYALVNQVRVRANGTETSAYEYQNDELSSIALEKFILSERGRELVFEGKRWFDILRYVKRDNYRNLDYLVNLAVLATNPEKVTVLQTKWANYPGSHYLPLPLSEVKINKNLEQNEFYK